MAWVGVLKTVAATATQLSTTAVDCVEVTVRCLKTNAGTIFFGNSGVTTSANIGVFLDAGESYTWGPSPYTDYDLREIYSISAGAVDKFALSYNKR